MGGRGLKGEKVDEYLGGSGPTVEPHELVVQNVGKAYWRVQAFNHRVV